MSGSAATSRLKTLLHVVDDSDGSILLSQVGGFTHSGGNPRSLRSLLKETCRSNSWPRRFVDPNHAYLPIMLRCAVTLLGQKCKGSGKPLVLKQELLRTKDRERDSRDLSSLSARSTNDSLAWEGDLI
jgi:hypothetical protein